MIIVDMDVIDLFRSSSLLSVFSRFLEVLDGQGPVAGEDS